MASILVRRSQKNPISTGIGGAMRSASAPQSLGREFKPLSGLMIGLVVGPREIAITSDYNELGGKTHKLLLFIQNLQKDFYFLFKHNFGLSENNIELF